jgi:uncharacterized membrane protein
MTDEKIFLTIALVVMAVLPFCAALTAVQTHALWPFVGYTVTCVVCLIAAMYCLQEDEL